MESFRNRYLYQTSASYLVTIIKKCMIWKTKKKNGFTRVNDSNWKKLVSFDSLSPFFCYLTYDFLNEKQRFFAGESPFLFYF